MVFLCKGTKSFVLDGDFAKAVQPRAGEKQSCDQLELAGPESNQTVLVAVRLQLIPMDTNESPLFVITWYLW